MLRRPSADVGDGTLCAVVNCNSGNELEAGYLGWCIIDVMKPTEADR
jgi:hypothetical protein